MKKILSVFLCLVIVLGLISGCGKKVNVEKEKNLSIEDIYDYYINYYNDLVIESYKLSYAGYKKLYPNGTKENFKNNYFKREKQEYSFYDVNNDGVQEFILITNNEKDENYTQDWKNIDIYTLDMDTKEVLNFLNSSLYFDNLFYNDNKNLYLTKMANEMGTNGTYELISYDENKKAYTNAEEILYNSETKKYYKMGDYFDGRIPTKYDFENHTISEEEFLSYTADLKEIKFDVHDIENIYDDYIDDEILKQIDEEMYGDNNDENLKCTKKDVDNIVNLLLSGKKVKISNDTDIKFSSNEVMQYYNSTYPMATIYTISCGSYSKSVRISHK